MKDSVEAMLRIARRAPRRARRRPVYWQAWDRNGGRWYDPPGLRLAYSTVREASRALIRSLPLHDTVFRLSRFDRTPLLTATLTKRGWRLIPWRELAS